MGIFEDKKTVFVIGAGASYDYGYPLGSKLTEMIIEGLKPGNAIHHIVGDPTDGIGDHGLIEQFRKRFFFSEVYSIDAFLKRTVARHPEYEKIGKMVTAALIIREENSELMFSKNSKTFNWLRHLFNLIDDDLKGEWEDLPADRFYFLNFNYDRTMEYYLHSKLTNLYGYSDDQVKVVLQKLNITHVHGHLGSLPFQDPAGRPYNGTHDLPSVLRAIPTIRIAYETMKKDHQVMISNGRIQRVIREANRLFFLGFSYHPDNMEILKLDNGRSERFVFGTGQGMSTTRNKELIGASGTIIGLEDGWSIEALLNKISLY